jgi:flagellar motor protein MotB
MVREAGKLVAACGSAVVYVGGHTDEATFDGSTLTLRRARTMIKVMRRAGAPEERLVPRGYGAQYPVDERGTAAARAKNERGSITVEGE